MKKISIIVILLAIAAGIGAIATYYADDVAPRAGAGPAGPDEEIVVEVDREIAARAAAIDTEAGCAAEGGTWRYVQSFFEVCVLPYPDAGISCTSSEECVGGCIVRDFASLDRGEGTCRADTSFGQCYAYVEQKSISCLFDDIRITCTRDSTERECQALLAQ